EFLQLLRRQIAVVDHQLVHESLEVRIARAGPLGNPVALRAEGPQVGRDGAVRAVAAAQPYQGTVDEQLGRPGRLVIHESLEVRIARAGPWPCCARRSLGANE